MTEWRTLTMSDVMDEFYDGPHATPAPADDGPIYLGIKNLTDAGSLDLREPRFIAEADYAKWTRRVTPREDDVVFTYEATLHRYAIIPPGFRGCLGRRLALIRPNSDLVLPRFLHLAMLGPTWRSTVSERIISGSTVDRIPIIEFPDFPIELPGVETQRKVVEVLGAIGDLIENNRRRIELLEQMTQAIYREWFVHFRYPAHEDNDLVDSDFGPIPRGWEAFRTGELVAAGVLEIGDGYRAKNAEMSDSGLPFIRVASVRDGHLDLTACDHLPLSYGTRLKGKASQPADTVICMKGTVGRSAFVHAELPPLAYSPQVSYWRSLDHEALAPSYVYSWIRSDDFRRQCGAVKGATDMADYVNLKDQRRMRLLRPSAAVMSAFDASVEPMIRSAGTLRSQIDRLAATRDLLLPKLVTGEIDVSELDLDALVEAAGA